MPVYAYKKAPGAEGCEFCSQGFEVLQKMTEDRIEQCPECGGPVERQLYAVGIAAPHTNAELKNLGFSKLVKRDNGVYENMTRTGEESRYMEQDKPETMPNIKRKIGD